MTSTRIALLLAGSLFPLSTPVAGQAAPAPAHRAGHVLVTAGSRGGVYLIGGQAGEELRTADTLWHWNGAVWTALADDGPRYRTLPAAGFDSRRGVLVVYGGYGPLSGTRYGDTWEWDGRRWTERAVRSPGARDHHAMAFDEARGVMVMFGGGDWARTTWTWDGDTWRAVDSAGPPPVVHHAMSYDPQRQRIVLTGGRTRDGFLTDVWEWDGVRWTVAPSSTPGPRVSHHRMTWDPSRGATLLFAGTETWTWDGRRWERLAVTGPGERIVSALAWDAVRRRAVLFGGGGPGGVPPYNSLRDVWEFDGVRWERRWP